MSLIKTKRKEGMKEGPQTQIYNRHWRNNKGLSLSTNISENVQEVKKSKKKNNLSKLTQEKLENVNNSTTHEEIEPELINLHRSF